MAETRKAQTQQPQAEYSSELDRLLAKPAADLDRYAEDAKALQSADMVGIFTRALRTAEIMAGIRNILKQPGVLDHVASLAGTAVGFRTDRDTSKTKPPYTPQEISDAVIEAVMMGLPLVGNCFNIIAHRCYVTLEGFGYLLRNLDGTVWQIVPGIPRMASGGAVIQMVITADYKGREIAQTLELPIKVNDGMGADAIIGKATRKARKWLYDTATGSDTPDGDILTDTVMERLAKATTRTAPEEASDAKGRLFAGDAATPDTPADTAPTPDPEPLDMGTSIEDLIASVVEAVGVPAELLADWTKALPGRHPWHSRGSLKQIPLDALAEMRDHADDARANVNAWVDSQNQ